MVRLALLLTLLSSPSWALVVGYSRTFGADVTAPTVSTATIAADGTTLTLAMSESVTRTGGTFDVDCATAGADITATYSSGSGSSTLVYTLGTTVESGDTCDLDYDGAADGIEDGAGNDLAAIVSGAVTNDSTVGASYCTQVASDDWARENASTLGANWTEYGGSTLRITSEQLTTEGGSWQTGGATHVTAAGSATYQFGKLDIVSLGGASTHMGLVLRGASASNRSYLIRVGADGEVGWYTHTPPSSNSLIEATTGAAWQAGQALCVTVSGTGTSTVTRIWRACTNAAPVASDGWDTAGDTADYSFTNDPSTQANDGLSAGVLSYYGDTSPRFVGDTWRFGTCTQ